MAGHHVRLLKFLTQFEMGGTERQAICLARTLDRTRFELRMACFHDQGSLRAEIEALRIPLTEFPISHLYGPRTLRQQLRFAARLRRDRIQVLHAYNFYPIVFAVPFAKLAGVPVVVASIRDCGVYLSPSQRRVQRLVCRLADRIVANAEAVRQWLVSDGHRPDKISVIRNGIDLSLFGPRPADGRLRREIGLPADSPIVAILTRLTPKKGVEDFLEAAAIVTRCVPHARFAVVGGGNVVVDGAIVPDVAYRQTLGAQALRLGIADRVVFTGMRLDTPQLLSDIAVSVLPSLSEGLSNALLESMAAGVPVVATRVGGNPEVVDEGRTGLLVPPQDPSALAQAICRLLEDHELASRFSLAGQRRVTELFSLERMTRETERLYLDLLERAR